MKERTKTRGLTPGDRVYRILLLIEDTLAATLRDHPAFDSYKISFNDKLVPLRDFHPRTMARLDAAQCLKMIHSRARDIFPLQAAQRAKHCSAKLLKLRNSHAHGEEIAASVVRRCARDASELFSLFGYSGASQAAMDFALPPSIAYVAELRSRLVEQAQLGALCTYEEMLAWLDLPNDDFGYRQLYRQLNVLAAKQLLLDEPQLCALVVLADKRIPGDGFYWVVDVPRNAPDHTKKAAHSRAVTKVLKHRW